MDRRGRLLASLVALSLAAAACSSGADPDPEAPPRSNGRGFPVTVSAANGEVTVPTRPERIVSLSPTATEILFAIGAGEQVVAVDDQSNHPPEAPTTDLSGFEPNVEAIAAFQPDLVVIADDVGDLVASLEALSIPVIGQPAAATLEDTYAQIEQLGEATGSPDAAAVVASMRGKVHDLVASVPAWDAPPTYYHELDDTFFTATSETFIGQVYALAGLANIADEARGAGTGYPQLSAEFIIEADPDLIFLADTKCCGQSADSIASRPGWDELTAVRTGGVVELDDDIASRWGPRVVDYLRAVVDAVSQLKAAA